MRLVRLGVVFPQTEIGTDPAVLRDYAQAAEGLGFSHLLAFDHVIGVKHEGREPPLTGPYTETDDFHEPLTLFSYLSAVTTRLTFVTGVMVLPQRQTALVAKQAAQVALLSGNRLRLGVGVGWNHAEYACLGADYFTRGRRQEEQVQVMRELWTGQVIDFHGTWHRIDRGAISPAPSRQIPVWFGGFSDTAHERAARIGDGFLFARVGEEVSGGRPTHAVDTVLRQAERMRARVDELGRDVDAFGLEGRINYRDAAEVRERERLAFHDAGFQYAAVNPMNAGIATPGEHVAALATMADELGLT